MTSLVASACGRFSRLLCVECLWTIYTLSCFLQRNITHYSCVCVWMMGHDHMISVNIHSSQVVKWSLMSGSGFEFSHPVSYRNDTDSAFILLIPANFPCPFWCHFVSHASWEYRDIGIIQNSSILGVWKIARWRRVLAAFPEDSHLALISVSWPFCNSSSRGSVSLFCLLWTCMQTHNTHTHTLINEDNY